MNSSNRGVFLVGYGGPEKPADVLPFLRDVTSARNIPEERVAEVAQQYKAIGDASPYNRLTAGQAEALSILLAARGLPLPVKAGTLHSSPRIAETLGEFLREGRNDLSVIILAPHRSMSSYDRYLMALDQAVSACRAQDLGEPKLRLASPWHARPGFLRAWADRVLDAIDSLSSPETGPTDLIFTAHSIPIAMAQASPYLQQLRETAEGVCKLLRFPTHHLAFQSRSGRPEDPWLEPDVGDLLEERARLGIRNAVVAPIGFLVDHAEVLYDLDILARKRAEDAGIRMTRALTVGDHPSFIALLSSLVEEAYGFPFPEETA